MIVVLGSIAKQLSTLLRLPASRMQFFFNNLALGISETRSLEELGIFNGATLEVFDNQDARMPRERKLPTPKSVDAPTELLHSTVPTIKEDVFDPYIPRNRHKCGYQQLKRKRKYQSASEEESFLDAGNFHQVTIDLKISVVLDIPLLTIIFLSRWCWNGSFNGCYGTACKSLWFRMQGWWFHVLFM